MNKLIIGTMVTLGLTVCGVTGYAYTTQFESSSEEINHQKKRGHAQKRKPNFEKLAFLLSLDETQASDLQTMINSHRAEMEANREKHAEGRENARSDARALREKHRAEVAGILDESQLEIFKLYMDQFRPKRKPPQSEQKNRDKVANY
ncbi:MAG: hypothetical protein OQK04_05030 [Kangiellaceae bacterium]|nr:hypothetical protein [Kangiellaceae bacterium]MCW8998058.1 hypothetical protein [Kangiellaceae bacterium]